MFHQQDLPSPRSIVRRAAWWLTAMALWVAADARGGLIIVPTYDQSLSDKLAPSDVTSVQNAFGYVIQQFQNRYSDPIQINITVAASPGTGILGQSVTDLVGYLNYADTRTALIADATSVDDAVAVASLGLTDPTGNDQFVFSRAEAKALGIDFGEGNPATDTGQDGTFTFGAG